MKITFSIYPKFFRPLDRMELAGLIHDCGLDAVNLVIREGYWCEPATMERDVRAFTRFMRGEGIDVRFATVGWTLEEVEKNPDWLRILSENGIAEFRMAYFEPAPGETLPALDEARRVMERMTELCIKNNIRVIYQVHHTKLISTASAAWDLVRGLPPSAVGVELDPGNQSFEGFEEWQKSVSLLGDYLKAYGIKDTKLARDASRFNEPDKGWARDWCSAEEGVVNWHEVTRPLARRRWSGTFVFMPFYHEHDIVLQARVLKREVKYIRNIVAAETAAAGENF
ncbi:sugar phosphate isomerase/epimerase family protein [Ereboglobus luteus]|uniref:Xylose isomerase-like TIM barrel domain-containing protein n=1 Tax=Ereboglobus luteus TaxID=1796921 RepID=A0A2U8E0L4_9BACT|nr:TIM barrel protein [Ereboglobus luteus]AWI08122.1 hypothetical protein CKA38_01580 [Ereboglobus luteus]